MTTSTKTQPAELAVSENQFEAQLRALLFRVRKVEVESLQLENTCTPRSIDQIVSQYADTLRAASKTPEAGALDDAREKIIDSKNFGGLGLQGVLSPSLEQQNEALFLIESWLEAIKSREQSVNYLSCRTASAPGVRPMTAAQKIFAQHVIGEKPRHGLAAGDVVRVGGDWILSSELSWGVCVQQSTVEPWNANCWLLVNVQNPQGARFAWNLAQ